jgi:hypothetical protein
MKDRILISEDWLKASGFKWHQIDRQPSKQWCLWLGDCLECPEDGQPDQQRWRFSGDEEFGIELTSNTQPVGADPDEHFWFCWFRGDSAGRYHRFIHVRHLRWQHEVIALVEAISGRPWHPERHWYGSLRCERHSEALSREKNRLDALVNEDRMAWYEAEKDETRDRALPEHLDEAIKSGRAK